MPTSPDPLNYYLGKGVLKWKGTLDSVYRDLGNVPLFELTPSVTRLPHYSSRLGIRFMDKNIVISKMLTCKFHLEEFTPENFALALMGTQHATSPVTVDIMNVDEVTGALRFIGTNEIGDKMQIDLASVNLAPSAAVSLIGETWGLLEVTGEVTADPTTGSFGIQYSPITGEIT